MRVQEPPPEAVTSVGVRRQLLKDLDKLLEDVEQCALADDVIVRENVVALGDRLAGRIYGGGGSRSSFPSSVGRARKAAFQMVGAVLGQVPIPRGAAQLSLTLSAPVRIKRLNLPNGTGIGLRAPEFGTPEWGELATGIVERAFDRWCLAQDLAVTAARRKDEPAAVHRLLEIAGQAWSNYYDLETRLKVALRPADRDVDRSRSQPRLPQLGTGLEPKGSTRLQLARL